MKVKLQKLDELRKGDGVTEEKRLAASRLFSRTLTFSIPASVDHEFTTFVAKEMSGLEYSSRADFNVTVTAENFRAEAVDLKKVFYTFSGLDAFVDTHFGDKDGQVEDDPDEVLMKDRLLIENPAMHALYKRLDIALSITGDFVKAFDAINPKEK